MEPSALLQDAGRGTVRMGNQASTNEERTADFVEGLVRANQSTLAAYMRRRIPSPTDAADACQEVFLRMCRIDHPSRIRNPRAFLFQTAQNIVQDYFRKRRVNEVPLGIDTFSAELRLTSPSPERVQYAREWEAAYRVAIEELTPRCRRVFVLCRVRNWPHAEIARELGISTKMVEKYMTKALAHLTVRLQEFLVDDFH